jgi:hypothetical protein
MCLNFMQSKNIFSSFKQPEPLKSVKQFTAVADSVLNLHTR